MGRDKALLTLPTVTGQPFTVLQHACTTAQDCGFRTYVLTPWPDRYRPMLSSSVFFLQEGHGNPGPLVAMAQGWSMILADTQNCNDKGPDWLLVLACDMPAIDALTIQKWQQALDSVDENEIAALPRQNHRWEPLCGFYHRRCLPSLQNAVASNIRSFQRWLANEPIMSLSIKNSHILQNCNTPAEWRHFLNSKKVRNL